MKRFPFRERLSTILFQNAFLLVLILLLYPIGLSYQEQHSPFVVTFWDGGGCWAFVVVVILLCVQLKGLFSDKKEAEDAAKDLAAYPKDEPNQEK